MPMTGSENFACEKDYKPEDKEFRIRCEKCDRSFTVRTKAILLRVALVCDHDEVLFEADPEVKQWADPPKPRLL